MSNYKISVITVCYNSEKTIERTIKSILNQTYDNFEYIIIDGLSSDLTLDIIKKYTYSFKGKMKWISEQDNGIYYAMNKGIKMANGDLICLLNSDDWYEPNAFEIMNNHYHGEPYKIQYAMQRIITKGKEEQCNILHHQFLNKHMIPHQTCFVTKSIYKEIGLFDTHYKSAADYDFTIRASLDTRVIFEPIYTILVSFRSGGMCSTIAGGLEQAQIKRKYGFITKKQFEYLKLKARCIEIAKRMNLLQ